MAANGERGKRPPNIERDRRLQFVEDLLVICTPRAQIIAMARAEFDVEECTVDEWIGRVRARWNVESEATRSTARAAIQAKLEHQQYLAAIDGDRKALVDLLKLEMDLHGLRSQQRVHVNAADGVPIEALTPEQRRQEIARLEQRRQEAELAAATKH